MQSMKVFRTFCYIVLISHSSLGSPLITGPLDNVIVNSATPPADCGAVDPCGWIHYRDNMNLFTRSDVTENVFCQCQPDEKCKLWETKVAYKVHIFKCQPEDNPRPSFPSLYNMHGR